MHGSDSHRVKPDTAVVAPETLAMKNTDIAKKAPGNSITTSSVEYSSALLVASRASSTDQVKTYILSWLDSKIFTVIITIATIFALIGDDFRLMVFSKLYDGFFFNVAFTNLILFGSELTLTSYAKSGYLFSFYFLLDFCATISLIPDIGWIWDPLIGDTNNEEASADALKAGKASRAGTKAGRIVRIVRLVRMVRIVKLYKMSKGDETSHLEAEIAFEPSKVGKKMSEMTTRRVIVIVLLLVIIIPFFDGGLDDSVNEYQEYGLLQMHIISSIQDAAHSSMFRNLFQAYVREAGFLIYLNITNFSTSIQNEWVSDLKFQDLNKPWSLYSHESNPMNNWHRSKLQPSVSALEIQYRSNEYQKVSISGCYNSSYQVEAKEGEDCISWAIFDVSENTRNSAGMSMLKTFFIMIVLGVSAVAFSRIAEVLVIGPIERMMDLIKRLAENPLASTKRSGPEMSLDKTAKEQGYETALLEATLSKIGALMQVGFGAAGADIIGKNMGSGELDPMLPGKKITAIYGFCDIRQFTDTTECLQEDVMVYVNKLGDIMHSGTHAYYGMANKNVGDAFLLSWKICDGELPGFSSFDDIPTEEIRHHVNENFKCPSNTGEGTVSRRITPTEMADSALTAFIKCLIDLDNANTKGSLTEYLSNERVVKRFGKNFRIRMGFGMHVGWAIEGAIGSRFKIDATYISPHVEMADRLEAGSKIFKTPINLSHWFVALLSPAARSFLRKIDCIKISGVSVPLKVFTFDVTCMKEGFGTPRIDEASGCQLPVDFEVDVTYSEIREGLQHEFLEVWNRIIVAYINGNWKEAEDHLAVAAQYRPDDGPSENLRNAMKEHNFVSPDSWLGYRQLDNY